MNKIKSMICAMALLGQGIAGAQTLTSAMADGNTPHTSSGSSVVSSSSSGSSSYSTSGTAPAKARPEEAFAYQLQQANQIAIAINARRMQNINSQIRSIQFNNPFRGNEPQTGFTDWNKEKSKFDNTTDNQDFSTLSTQRINTSSNTNMPGYVNVSSVMPTMISSGSTDFSEEQVLGKGHEDIQKEHLMEIADETVDKTIDEIEDEDVKSRMKSIKEIHNESYDLFEKMIDAFFKPYPQEIEEMIDRFFGDYESSVLVSFAKANPYVREKAEMLEKYGHIGELIFNKNNSEK